MKVNARSVTDLKKINTMRNVNDYTRIGADEIANIFWQRYLSIYYAHPNENLQRNDFYCGITDDLDRRAEEHNLEQFDCCAKCASFAISSEVERKLDKKGFDCGKHLGNGQNNSVYVYMYKKQLGVTKE